MPAIYFFLTDSCTCQMFFCLFLTLIIYYCIFQSGIKPTSFTNLSQILPMLDYLLHSSQTMTYTGLFELISFCFLGFFSLFSVIVSCNSLCWLSISFFGTRYMSCTKYVIFSLPGAPIESSFFTPKHHDKIKQDHPQWVVLCAGMKKLQFLCCMSENK